MKKISILVVAILIVAISACKKIEDDKKVDINQLEGTWNVETIMSSGQDITNTQFPKDKGGKLVHIFSDLKDNKGKYTQKTNFSYNPATNDFTIGQTMTDNTVSTFELENDTIIKMLGQNFSIKTLTKTDLKLELSFEDDGTIFKTDYNMKREK